MLLATGQKHGTTWLSLEFRRRVLELIESGHEIVDVARNLDVNAQTICAWRRQDRIDRGLEPGTRSMEHAARQCLWNGGPVPDWKASPRAL